METNWSSAGNSAPAAAAPAAPAAPAALAAVAYAPAMGKKPKRKKKHRKKGREHPDVLAKERAAEEAAGTLDYSLDPGSRGDGAGGVEGTESTKSTESTEGRGNVGGTERWRRGAAAGRTVAQAADECLALPHLHPVRRPHAAHLLLLPCRSPTLPP